MQVLAVTDAGDGAATASVSGTPDINPEIGVSSSEGGAIADGGTDNHGGEVIEAAKTVTYTVSNTGSGDLSVSNITVSGATNITGTPTISRTSFTVAESGSETFSITYTPDEELAFGFNIEITSDDSDESPIISPYRPGRRQTCCRSCGRGLCHRSGSTVHQVTDFINQRVSSALAAAQLAHRLCI